MEIRSIFGNNERIPAEYTCDGENTNPPLEFVDVPKDAKSLVLIVDDPDSPSKVWSHWVLGNIPPSTKKIPEDSAPKGAVVGMNDFGKIEYGGPCPHSGTHRYQFKLFALDRVLYLASGFSKKDAETDIKGHIIERAVLTGIYSR